MAPEPIVYGRRRLEADAELSSEHSSSPSFQIVSPPFAQLGKDTGGGGDSSYDTSVASVPPPKGAIQDQLETDVESDMEEPVWPSFVARMQKKKTPSNTDALFLSDDEPQYEAAPRSTTIQPNGMQGKLMPLPVSPRADARTARMEKLRGLAQQRAAHHAQLSEQEPPEHVHMQASTSNATNSPSNRPPRSPTALSHQRLCTENPSMPLDEAIHSDVSDDELDEEIRVPAPSKGPRGLSRKDQREMHSMSAKLRRENRTRLVRPEPKRYQLSELLSTIEHTASPTSIHAMNSSDPVESSSTPDARHALVPPQPSTSPSDAQARTKKKWEWIQRQKKGSVNDGTHEDASGSDSDLEVIALGPHPPRPVPFSISSPRDRQRDAADHALAHLAVYPRTPRRQRISTNEYRSPNAGEPHTSPVPDRQLDAMAHTFGFAANQQAGTLPAHTAATLHHSHPHQSRPFPSGLGLDELNATVLQKVYAQNAELTAKKDPHLKSDEQGTVPASMQTPAPAQAQVQSTLSPTPTPPVSPPAAALNDRSLFPSPSPSPPHLPPSPPLARPESRASVQSDDNSEKENVPPPAMRKPSSQSRTLSQHAPLTELPVSDLGDYFVPTQVPAQGSMPRAESNSSVLAQFFEQGTQEPQQSGSLDIFANDRRSGPVGGMTQFFEATPAGSSMSRSQEAMPPPSRTYSGADADAFGALRRAERAAAAAPQSPDMFPSLDPSLAEHGEEVWREAQRAQKARHNEVLYLNEDGFFTQTKPTDEMPSLFVHDHCGESGSDNHEDNDKDLVRKRAKSPLSQHRRRPQSAFVFGEAEESDEDEDEARGEHGGLAGIFSDDESLSNGRDGTKRGGNDDDGDDDSDADADLSSLLDDESDQDVDVKDDAVHQKYLQDRQNDDAALQAVHERATKGLFRHRRRGRNDDDRLADLLDEDADEDELRRRLQAPRFSRRKRRCIEGDGMDALAVRDDAQAFVKTYAETHAAGDDHAKYDFLESGDVSSDEERVTAHDVRVQLLAQRAKDREQVINSEMRTRPMRDDEAIDKLDHTQDNMPIKLKSRSSELKPAAGAGATPGSDDDGDVRVLFKSGKVDESALPRAVQEKRAQLLEEYSHEPQWHDVRGGRGQLDRRRTRQAKRPHSDPLAHRAWQATPSAPSVLKQHILRREARFP